MAKKQEPKQLKESEEKPAEQAQAVFVPSPAPEKKAVHPKFQKFLKGEK